MARQTVSVMGNGDQTRPTAKNGDSTPSVMNRDTQKAILRPVG